MLILSRKMGEKIMIGDSIEVTVSRISGNRVTLGISAPNNVHIVRAEIEPIVNAFRDRHDDAPLRQPSAAVSLESPMVCAAPLVS
jgi:carbon storage regulator CsrA